MAEPNARFRLAPDVATRAIDGGLLLVNLQNGATWKLNQVGAAVAQQLDGATDVATIAAATGRRFAAPIETVRGDVERLLDDLEKQGLIESATTAG